MNNPHPLDLRSIAAMLNDAGLGNKDFDGSKCDDLQGATFAYNFSFRDGSFVLMTDDPRTVRVMALTWRHDFAQAENKVRELQPAGNIWASFYGGASNRPALFLYDHALDCDRPNRWSVLAACGVPKTMAGRLVRAYMRQLGRTSNWMEVTEKRPSPGN